MQLMELDIPMVLALNMMDEVRGNGGTIDINETGGDAGHPGGPHFRRQKRGHRMSWCDHAVACGKVSGAPGPAWISAARITAVQFTAASMRIVAPDRGPCRGRQACPVRFAATKLVEGDDPH